MGKLVRAGQIFVTSLDATPRETDVLTGLASIDAGEITADEIQVANLKITGELTSISDTTQFAGTTNVNRLTATQIGIGTDNPINDLQIGTNDLIVNRTVQNLVTVRGNVVSTNVLATDTFKTTNDSFVVDADNSNVITVTGNTVSTNVTVNKHLHVGTDIVQDTGANVAVFENGNVVIRDGFLQVFGNIDVSGNLSITEIPSYTSVNNLVVSNAVILMGDGNNGTYDMAVLMRDGAPDTSNVFLGYTHVDDTFKLSRTYGTPEDATFTMDSANTVNLHVFGDIYTQNNVGIANTSPAFSLSVGSNVYINDVASSSANVLHANGYGFFEGLRIGDDGLTVGSLITLDADAAIPMVVSSKIEADGIQTTGVNSSGIANTNPAHTLSIGDKIFFSTTDANAVTVIGNTATGRLITESIRVQDFIEVEGESGISSAANVIIHGDITGEDSTSNTVSIRAGPLTSNISALEINGAKESPSHQSVIIKTKNTERLRVVSGGNVGLSNTEPSELLTLGGNLKLNDSNAAILGSDTTYLKAFTDVNGNQTRIENRVGTGKGLNFYASTTDTMGTPKMTILETSNVGIGTITPKGLLHTSGGTVFINNEPVNRVAYNHLNTPMVISNTVETEDTVSQEPILELTREGVLNNYEAVRATFKLGKHDLTNNKSKTQLDIYLADEDYSDETDILTLRSDGRVGIGSTVPEAFLEVVSSGIGNARENSLMIHNHHGAGGAGDAIMAAQTDATQGNAFTSYIQTTNDSNPRGWSVGITGTRDFRITRNINEVSDSTNVGMYIDGSTRNMGIGTDTPRAKLEVNGNVVIGNELYFGGLLSDEYGNTFIKERRFAGDVSELLIFKGNEGPGGQGPDQIRFVGSQHVFQAYSDPQLSASDISDMEGGVSSLLKPAMLISGGGSSGRVLIGTTDTTKIQQPDTTTLFVNGGVEFAPGQKINFGNMDIYALSDGGRFETIGSSGDMRFQNKATATTQELFATESMRIKSTGLIGIGTTDPSTNVHIYSGVTSDIDVLKLESPGTNTKTGISLNTNDGYGGYVRGYTTSGTTHGIVVGGMNNSVEADGLHVIHTSNVGVGTSSPDAPFHVYNGVARVESTTSSNAIIEIKTTGGTSNVLGDVSGNVYVNPSSGETIINSNLEVTGDLAIDGKIDLGNQVAVDLGGATANTALHVGGGFISGSNEVACKRYSKSFIRIDGESKDIQLGFGNGSFYAKIVAILRRRDGGPPAPVRDMSTLVLEVQGGTHDESTSVLDEVITIGTKNLFGGDTDYPWSSDVTAGTKGIIITPSDPSATRQYSYDIHVELISSKGGKLVGLYTNNAGGVDDFEGTTLQTYTY